MYSDLNFGPPPLSPPPQNGSTWVSPISVNGSSMLLFAQAKKKKRKPGLTFDLSIPSLHFIPNQWFKNVVFMFKFYPKFGHFQLPPPSLHWSEPPSSFTWTDASFLTGLPTSTAALHSLFLSQQCHPHDWPCHLPTQTHCFPTPLRVKVEVLVLACKPLCNPVLWTPLWAHALGLSFLMTLPPRPTHWSPGWSLNIPGPDPTQGLGFSGSLYLESLSRYLQSLPHPSKFLLKCQHLSKSDIIQNCRPSPSTLVSSQLIIVSL